MEPKDRKVAGAVIVADVSADWCCAGLRQIDRLLLSLNEAAQSNGLFPLCVYGLSKNPISTLPASRLPNLRLVSGIDEFCREMGDRSVIALNTHLVFDRGNGIRILQNWIAQGSAPIVFPATKLADALHGDSFGKLFGPFHGAETPGCHYLATRQAIPECERNLLRGAIKPQDGIISRMVNRPISRALTRFLLRTSITPNQWTVLVLLLPLAGAICLVRATYVGFVTGALLFQLHSALDGCDGEIARLKYLESAGGAKLDEVCDRSASLSYIIGLGIGLWRRSGIALSWQWFYFWEALAAAMVIGVGETFLALTPIEQTWREGHPAADYAARHRTTLNPGDQLKLWIIQHSKMLFLGERATSVFAQLTKRDVFNFLFLVLALCDRPTWILHIFAATAGIMLILALKNLVTRRGERKPSAGYSG